MAHAAVDMASRAREASRRDSAIPADLAERIRHGAGLFFGFEVDPMLGSIEVRAHPYSTIARVELAWKTESQWLYLKIPPRTPRNEHILAARLATEFRVLTQLWEHFHGNAKLGVVQPYGLYSDPPAIATVEAKGATLRHLLGRRARRAALPGARRELREHAALCGTWLRDFQQVTSQGTAPFDTGELIDYCRVRLELLSRHDATRFGKAWADRVLARLEEVSQSAAHADHEVSGRHNDFASHNVIAGPQGVRVLDFSMFDHGSRVYDTCNFWLDLELLKADLTYSRSVVGDMQEAFLAAHGSVDPADPLFQAVRCRYTLNRLLTVLDASGRGGLASLGHRRLANMCDRWLAAFVAER